MKALRISLSIGLFSLINYSNICDKICTLFPDRFHKMMILQLFVYGSIKRVYPYLLPLQDKLTISFSSNIYDKRLKNRVLFAQQSNKHLIQIGIKTLGTKKCYSTNSTQTYLFYRRGPVSPGVFSEKRC